MNSKFSVEFSVLVGRYLPKLAGHRIADVIAYLISSLKNLEINRAIRLNQFMVQGGDITLPELFQRSRKVLTHGGRCYYDLYHFIDKKQELEELVPITDTIRDFVKLTTSGKGFLVVAPHLSNFDLVVSRLVSQGFKALLLSYPNPGSGYQLQNQIRISYGLNLIPADTPNVESALTAHLKAGGVVATGVDRPLPGRKNRHLVDFFGSPSPLPVGYVSTALAAGVPILPVSAIMEKDGTYGFRFAEPIEMQPAANKLETLILNAERVLKSIEDFIRLAPEQWLMYYPVWPHLQKEVV